MPKVSMLEASKLFAVSRPTLMKHLKQGKITGEKVTVDKNVFWKLEMSELARAYPQRIAAPPKQQELPPEFTNSYTPPDTALHAEIKLLQAKLDAAERLLEERQKHLDDLRGLLTDRRPAERRPWWRW